MNGGEFFVTGAPRRLDVTLREQFTETSRNRIQQAIRAGRVRVNDQPGRPGDMVSDGDRVAFDSLDEPVPEEPLPPAAEQLVVLYEDEELLAVDKPSGLACQPPPGRRGGSLLEAARARGWRLAGGEDPARAGLVHRLDRDTSGVLLLAKSERAHAHLQQAFREQRVQKIYHCLASGSFLRMEFHCDAPLARDPQQRTTRRVDTRGRPAQTQFRVLRLVGRFALLEARPLTGRTHQIRAHLKHLGHFILGDPLYGPRHLEGFKPGEIARTMLHSRSLTFPALDGRSLTLSAPEPEDFTAFARRLGLSG